ncbi:hypothetical protein IscW_ISCW004799 [Ixodes scapularis]|uniref:Uncharacterized protein n=1 Tax=Ixodes scapularis TaxID=6945 RepID=B7PJT5_IXOSC|nr:hypothetical protein IscW_ISCW004799 [Ixodes scapularis]|eukprot:XP_002408550.1 hypothetical protein IscW_ISCW004799 [Ixodes scapularis]
MLLHRSTADEREDARSASSKSSGCLEHSLSRPWFSSLGSSSVAIPISDVLGWVQTCIALSRYFVAISSMFINVSCIGLKFRQSLRPSWFVAIVLLSGLAASNHLPLPT